jgi:hypothetical protein
MVQLHYILNLTTYIDKDKFVISCFNDSLSPLKSMPTEL